MQAVQAVQAGANVKAVQRMLGHASAAMTLDVYAGLFNAVARADHLRTVAVPDGVLPFEVEDKKGILTCGDTWWGGHCVNHRFLTC